MDYKKLAELLFPDVTLTIEDLEKRYSKRNLPEGAMVTRIAPSPTGFVHIGTLFTSLINERLAHESNGLFYLRIEDTDRKREVEGGIKDIVQAFKNFNIIFDEGTLEDLSDKGEYGPYAQSKRVDIYKACIKHMIQIGFAYPCFCSQEDLENLRKQQEDQGIRPGYYGKWAVDRNLSITEIEEKIKKGLPYIIRFKSPGKEENRVICKDLIKGDIEMQENDQDIVILKSDGLPTYHFAHILDDYFMKSTHVLRADEWLASLPLHLQLFECAGFDAPKYGHISPIMKEEGASRRKLSKRKDPEAAVSYYFELGFPNKSIKEYLLTLINSDFEDWRIANPKEPCESFIVRFEKMSTSGALLDMNKMLDVSKNTISRMTAKEIFELSIQWAYKYEKDFAELIDKYKDYTINIFNIERESDRPRKDIGKWSEVKENIGYFYDELFDKNIDKYDFDEKLSSESIKEILSEYVNIYNEDDDKNIWFEKVKELADKLGYAKDMKAYKQNPEGFKGSVADVASVLRVALTKRRNTPDLHQMMEVMGKDRVIERFKRCIDKL